MVLEEEILDAVLKLLLLIQDDGYRIRLGRIFWLLYPPGVIILDLKKRMNGACPWILWNYITYQPYTLGADRP